MRHKGHHLAQLRACVEHLKNGPSCRMNQCHVLEASLVPAVTSSDGEKLSSAELQEQPVEHEAAVATAVPEPTQVLQQ